ncbi:MAG: type II toxin-antitoxin system RelE/ParE family toxin [Segetibacter sp.]
MAYTVYITPTAIDDIEEALQYYNSKVADLGFKFTDDVNNNLQRIAQNPYAFTERYKNVRGKLLKKFPYLILYKVNNTTAGIEVIRLFNTYQNLYWS